MLAMELMELGRARSIRREVQVAGLRAVYYEYPSESFEAQTIVMIHGYRGTHRGLEAIAAGLSSYRVIVPDLPGFGESLPLDHEHTVANYSNWLGEFLIAIGVAQDCNLVGHSFGTLIVGDYAAKFTIKSLILINAVSGPALEGPREFLTKITRLYYRVADHLPKAISNWLLRNRLAVMVMSISMTKTKDRKLRKWIHRQHIQNFSSFSSVHVAAEGFYASISTDLSKIAALIQCPVLVIASELDDITTIERQRAVAMQYPRCTLREIPGVGHLVHYEAPEIAASHIDEFLVLLD